MRLVIPFNEISDTNDWSLILSLCSLPPAPLLPTCIKIKVKWYEAHSVALVVNACDSDIVAVTEDSSRCLFESVNLMLQVVW